MKRWWEAYVTAPLYARIILAVSIGATLRLTWMAVAG